MHSRDACTYMQNKKKKVGLLFVTLRRLSYQLRGVVVHRYSLSRSLIFLLSSFSYYQLTQDIREFLAFNS